MMEEKLTRLLARNGVAALEDPAATRAELEEAVVELAQSQAELEDALVELAAMMGGN